ncbi:MAG TPA: HdeD family acid-resistance protein [Terriglobales bacterium]|jgi:uncharacterized membrane protein HdeD (DUF308 family)|nr:HdeD family acid-resistance protein [Terriglobales bacterium]
MTATLVIADGDSLRHKWGWFLGLGIVLILLGTIALVIMPVTTIATVMVLGWLMVFSGVIEAIHAFQVRGWRGELLHLVAGLLGIVLGLLVVTHPLAGAIVWTMLIASFFLVVGTFRLVAAIRMRFLNWGWTAFDGAVTLLLGIILWTNWPWSGLWFLGLSVGISLILRGWAHVMLALALRGLFKVTPDVRRAA